VVREAVLMSSAEKHRSKITFELVRHTPLGVHFAIKSIAKHKLKEELPHLRRELEILQTVDHPNIVKLFETYEDAKYVHLVMEMCPGGDLLERMASHDGLFAEEEATMLMKKLLGALNHIHRLYIVHRDLKPENMLFSTKDETAEVKITDFGISKKFSESHMESVVGTPYYMAPEVLRGHYGREVDVWALGVILYMLLSGRQPFIGQTIDEIFKNIAAGNYSLTTSELEDVSPEGLDLIRQMLAPNPSERITVEAALRHPWFILKLPRKSRSVSKSVIQALRAKHSHNQFKREVMKTMIKHLTSEQIQDLQDAFAILDTESIGTLTVTSLKHALERLGVDIVMEEVEGKEQTGIVASTQYSSQGKITYSEFLMATLNWKHFADEENLWVAFKHLDPFNRELITVNGLRQVFARSNTDLDEAEFQAILAELHLSSESDSEITFEQFKVLMTKMLAQSRPQSASSSLKK
jgi:calcium-dependent protein kinase